MLTWYYGDIWTKVIEHVFSAKNRVGSVILLTPQEFIAYVK